MKNWIKNLLEKMGLLTNKEWKHFVASAWKDSSGRIRHKIFVNGELVKEEITFECWYSVKKNGDPTGEVIPGKVKD